MYHFGTKKQGLVFVVCFTRWYLFHIFFCFKPKKFKPIIFVKSGAQKLLGFFEEKEKHEAWRSAMKESLQMVKCPVFPGELSWNAAIGGLEPHIGAAKL